jgi:hypothetical protein
MEPFAARLDIEIIQTDKPLSGDRNGGDSYESGGQTKYVHMLLNQRTIPLGMSYDECGQRDDGWCELETFLELLKKQYPEAEYEYSCFGDYDVVPYGQLTDGVPQGSGSKRVLRG